MDCKTTDKICSRQVSSDCVKMGDRSLFLPNSRVCKKCKASYNHNAYVKNADYESKLNLIARREQKLLEQLGELQEKKRQIKEREKAAKEVK